MVFIEVLALRKRFKWRAIIAIVLLQSLNVGAHSGQTVNRQNHHQRSSVSRGKQNNGKRNVLYNYVTDRPRIPFGRFYQTSRASPRSALASIEAQKQRLAQLLKYRQYLTKLYSRRRSDIDSPVLQGDISDYKGNEYQGSPEAGNQIKGYESVEDINKKIRPKDGWLKLLHERHSTNRSCDYTPTRLPQPDRTKSWSSSGLFTVFANEQ